MKFVEVLIRDRWTDGQTDGRTDTEVGAMDLWSCLERERERARERERERERDRESKITSTQVELICLCLGWLGINKIMLFSSIFH